MFNNIPNLISYHVSSSFDSWLMHVTYSNAHYYYLFTGIVVSLLNSHVSRVINNYFVHLNLWYIKHDHYKQL